MKSDHKNDALPGHWFMLSNAIPPIGLFLYFKHRSQYPTKAKRALLAAIIGIPIALMAGYIMNTFILI